MVGRWFNVLVASLSLSLSDVILPSGLRRRYLAVIAMGSANERTIYGRGSFMLREEFAMRARASAGGVLLVLRCFWLSRRIPKTDRRLAGRMAAADYRVK